MRVVADPNIRISAAISPNGVPAQIVTAAREGAVQLVACPHLLAELAGVLARPRFRRWLSIEQAERYVADIAGLAEPQPNPELPYPIATRDPNDDYLVALTITAHADALISGDPDLTALSDPTVLTPRQLLDRIQDR